MTVGNSWMRRLGSRLTLVKMEKVKKVEREDLMKVALGT